MLKKLAIVFLILLAIVGVLAGVVAMQPADFRVERKTTIAAPAADVFVYVDDFHKWEAWSPWQKLDPNAKNSFEGPTSGKGAMFKWVGNSDVGEGKMTILESHPSDLIKIKLDFIKPFEDTSTVDFTFKEDAGKTEVTWSMYGKHNFMSKAMCMVMSMDKMIGDKFDEGLASLKSAVEAPKK